MRACALSRGRTRAGLLATAAAITLWGSASATAQVVPVPVAPGTPPAAVQDAAQPPNAQTAAPTPSADATQADVIVTGSLIRGQAPVGSSLIAVGHDSFANSGTLTVSDALKDVPQITALGVDESHRGVQGGAGNIFYNNQINIRSLGPQATLTLINGHRAPSTGTSGFGIDPSVIPSIAVERVEIVADGASATYGSDAVAGVANIITRKRFKGLEVTSRVGAADSYDENQQSIIGGLQSDTAGIMLAFERSYHSRLEGVDRPFFRYDLRSYGGTDFRSTQCNPGNILIGSTRYAIPAGGVTQANAAQLVPGTANLCDTYNTRSILPEQERLSLYSAAHAEVTPGITLFAEGYWYRRDFDLAAPNTTPAQTYTVPRSNPYFVLPPGANPAITSEQVEYYVPGVPTSFLQQGGVTSWQITGGTEIKLPHRWRATIQGSYGRDHSTSTYPQVNAAATSAALASTNPAIALDPFAAGIGPNNPTTLASLFSQQFSAEGITKQTLVEARLDGPLFHLPGGDLSVALGAGYRHESLFSNSYTVNPNTGFSQAPINPSRNIKSLFGEVSIPIFGPENARPGLRRLDIDAAVRYEDYSDIGGTTNPKVGINWMPIEGFTLRGSYGTSFRAPTLGDINNPNPRLYVQHYVDPASPTGFTDALDWVDNNPSLRPETATTYSLGLDVAPPGLRGLRAAVNYFNIDYENEITNFLNVATRLQQADLYSAIIIRNPTTAFVQSLLARLPVTGVLPQTITVILDSRNRNLGTIKTAGLDGTISYTFDTGIGQLRAAFDGTYFLNYDVSITPSATPVDRLSQINFPLRYNFRSTLGWSRKAANAAFTFAYEPPYNNTSVTPVQRVHSYLTVDTHLGLDLPGNSVLHGARLSVDITNMFDRAPPFVNTAGGYDPNLASALGRKVLLSIGWRL